jgi:predicted small metal-binding protein
MQVYECLVAYPDAEFVSPQPLVFLEKCFYGLDDRMICMAKEEYKQFSCSDIGMACGFQLRAKTEAEVMKHAKMHAMDAHGMKEMPPEVAEKIKAAIKSVQVDVPKA